MSIEAERLLEALRVFAQFVFAVATVNITREVGVSLNHELWPVAFDNVLPRLHLTPRTVTSISLRPIVVLLVSLRFA